MLHKNFCQQLVHAAVLSLLNHLFWVIIITYNAGGIYIFVYIYIYKVSYIHCFFVIFNFNVFFALRAKHFEIWKKMLLNLWLLHSKIHEVMWCFWVFIVNPFSLFWSFSSQENVVSFGLLVSCLLLSQAA